MAMQTTPEIWGNDGLERLYPCGRYECEDLNVPIPSQGHALKTTLHYQRGSTKPVEGHIAPVPFIVGTASRTFAPLLTESPGPWFP
jgi:hypothetical protein